MNKKQKLLFKMLYESRDGLQGFTLYHKISITPGELMESVESFISQELIYFNNGRLTLSDQGRRVVEKLFSWQGRKNRIEDSIPPKYLGPKVEVNSPFLPNRSLLPYEIIPKITIEEGDETSI